MIYVNESFCRYLWNNKEVIIIYWIIDMGWDLIDLTCNIKNQILILLILGLIKLLKKYED